MKFFRRYLCCNMLFILAVLAADRAESPREVIRRQIAVFEAAVTTDAKLEAAKLLGRLILADGREEEFDRMFRQQTDTDQASAAPLVALSECMRVWGCPAESARLLAEASRRQPSDLELQALLAERYERNGNPALAAPILARLLADHRNPEHLRRNAAFSFRTGDIDQGRALANQLTHEAKDGREPEALAVELLSLREWEAARDILVPLVAKFRDDWRLRYLHACALERLSPDASAFAAFRSLISVQAEIPGFIPPGKDSTIADFIDSPERQQYLSRLSPDEALLARYQATHNTAYPADPIKRSGFFLGGIEPDPTQALGRIILPATVLELRLNALRHCFTLAADLPAASRAGLLAQINAPDLPFLDALKNEALASPVSSPSPVGLPVTKGHLFLPATDEASTKLAEISKALQTAVSTADYATAADLANQAIKHYSTNHVWPKGIFDRPEKRSDHLQRIVGDSPKPFTTGEILGLFQIRDFIQALASNGATFFHAPSPKPPVLSPARLELLKTLGEKLATPELAPGPGFTISDPEKIAAAVKMIESPFHRILILHACKLEVELRQALAELIDPAAAPAGDLLLWASAYQASEGHDLRLAYDLAIRARAVLGPEHQAATDAHLVALGRLLSNGGEAPLELTAARSAALEFSRFAVDESCRKGLAEVFKSFGQNEAAATLASPHFLTSARSREMSQPRKSPQDAAASATQADRPAALRQLYRHLRAALRSNRLGRSSSFSPNEFIDSIQKLQLVPDLTSIMLPPPGASYDRRRDYAIIMAKLDGLTKYVPLIETLHAEQPDDTAILSLLCAASPMPRRLALFRKLCQFPGDDLSDFADALAPSLFDHYHESDDAYRRMISEWHTVPTILAALPREQSASKHLAWLNEAVLRLAMSSSLSFYDFSEARRAYASDTPGKVELALLRDAAVKEVAIAMLKHPETASSGFILLSAGKIPFALGEDALHAMAMDAYRTKLSAADFQERSPSKQFISYHQEGHFRNIGSSFKNYTWSDLTPFRNLLARANASNRFHQSSDFLLSLPEPARNEMAAWLDYFAAPTPAGATALLRSLERECQSSTPQNGFTLALEITALCNINPTPGLEMLVDHAGVTTTRESMAYSSQGSPPVIPLVRGICGTLNHPAPLVARAVARVLGPPSSWPLYAAALGDGSKEYSVIEQRHQTFTTIVKQPELAIVRLGLATGLLGIDGYDLNLPTIDSYCSESTCAARLISSGLFLPGPGMFFPSGAFLPLSVARLKSDDPKDDPEKTVGTALLAVEGPNRFWARIAGAYWTRLDSAIPLSEVTRELATIQQWSEAEQRLMARFLKERWPDLADSSLAGWLDPPPRMNSAELEAALRKLPERFGADSFKADEIPPLLFPLIEQNPRQAAALWLENLAAASSDASQRAHGLLLETLLNYKSPYPKVAPANNLTFVFSLLQSNNPTVANHDHGPVLDQFTRRLIDSPPLDAKPAPEFKALRGIRTKTFAALLLLLRNYDDTAAPYLLAPLLKQHRSLGEYSAESCQSMLGWLETTIAPDRPQLAKAARLVALAGSSLPLPSIVAERQELALLEFLRSPQLAPIARLHLLQTAGEALKPLVRSPQVIGEAIAILDRTDLRKTPDALIAYDILTNLESGPAITPELAATACTGIIPELLADDALPMDHRGYLQGYWLRLAAKSGQDALFKQAREANAAAVTGDLDLIMLLLESGMWQAAATIVPPPELPGWSKADQRDGYCNDPIPCFTATIQRHLSPFLQQLPDAAQRFRVETLIANFPDAEGPDKPSLPRAVRLQQLAARFPAEAPPGPLIRSELLSILGAGEPPVNLPEMLTLTEGLSCADLFDAKNTAHDSYNIAKARPLLIQLTLIERTIQATLQTGRSDFWCRQMADLTRFSDLQTQVDHYRFRKKLFDTYGPKFINLALNAPPAAHDPLLREAAAIAAGFALPADVLQHDQWSDISNQTYQFLIFVHLATRHAEEFATCWAALPTILTKPREITPDYSGARVLECFDRAEFTAADGSNTAPQLFAALLLDPALSVLILPGMAHLHRIIEVNFLTGAEVAAAIEAVPDTSPRKPVYLLGRATLSGYYDNQTEAALHDCDRALKLAAAKSQPAVVELAKATQVGILVRADRRQLAINLAATVDATQLDEKHRKDFIHLTQFLRSKSE